MPGADVLGALFAQTAVVAAVVAVHLLFFLAAGQLRLLDVDDDDVIPRVDVRGVDAFVLALQQVRREAGHASDRVLSGIDDVPLAVDPARGGDER